VEESYCLKIVNYTGIDQKRKAEEACSRMNVHDDYILTNKARQYKNDKGKLANPQIRTLQ